MTSLGKNHHNDSEALNLEFPNTCLAVIVNKGACAILLGHSPDLVFILSHRLLAECPQGLTRWEALIHRHSGMFVEAMSRWRFLLPEERRWVVFKARSWRPSRDAALGGLDSEAG